MFIFTTILNFAILIISSSFLCISVGQADCFIAFEDDVSSVELPRKFTYPFYYEPHELSLRAAEQLQRFIRQQDWNQDFLGDEPSTSGIMFGVLVVKDPQGKLGFLVAFSGKLADSNHHKPFVPPVFDILAQDGFFRQEEKKIEQLTAEIEARKNAPELRLKREDYQRHLDQSERELTEARAKIKEGKKARKLRRKEAEGKLGPQEYEQLEASLVKESKDDQFTYKRLAKHWKEVIEGSKSELDALLDAIQRLKEDRKNLSSQTQARMFDQYRFLNGKGSSRSLLSIFDDGEGWIPPAGAGECAAPKLLQYAYLHDLQPIAMAEFWWGRSPRSEVRKHQQFYPSCRGKCEPILGHMLQGLEVEPNEMLEGLKNDKELDIIYEDEYLLAVNKPAEFLSVPGKEIQDSVYTRVRERYPEADAPLVVHRLDMSTSGIMLVAKSKDVHKLIQQQFEQRTVKKRYVALLEGELTEKGGEINLPLRVDFHDRPRQLVCYDHGKPARTIWELVEVADGRSLVRFYPVTGRTHQLRVHAAHTSGLGIPIVGDDLYGNKDSRLHLHAEQLRFFHPILEKEMTLRAAVPF